jgi:hypothetical protein
MAQMRRITMLGMMLAAVILAQPSPAGDGKDEGFTSLFNGKDRAGRQNAAWT